MKVITPDFSENNKKPKEVVDELLNNVSKDLHNEHEFSQVAIIFADENKLMFVTNVDFPQLNYILDLTKIYTLTGD